MPLSDGAGDERNEGASSLPKPSDEPHGSSQYPARKDARGLVDGDRVHWPQEHTNDGDGDCVPNQRRHEPDDEFQAAGSESQERKSMCVMTREWFQKTYPRERMA